MPFKIVRNDITAMETDAVVNTANRLPAAGPGCDMAIYEAAGKDLLLAERKKIGIVEEGDVFLTPGFGLKARYIIHAVSPEYREDGLAEEKLRSCYRKSLHLAREQGFETVAFPLISSGSFGYPREEALRIAADEINGFLLEKDMMVYLVVFDEKSTELGEKLVPDLEKYIDQNYVEEKLEDEYGIPMDAMEPMMPIAPMERNIPMSPSAVQAFAAPAPKPRRVPFSEASASGAYPMAPQGVVPSAAMPSAKKTEKSARPAKGLKGLFEKKPVMEASVKSAGEYSEEELYELHQDALKERMRHLSDTFQQYLLYLIENKGMTNAEVYKRAIVDKKVFAKIKANPDYHPKKLTALCLCVGAKLNLDETRDLLARAGYALSPCDKADVIFSYFIENEIYDMIEIDIQLEEHGLPCIIG